MTQLMEEEELLQIVRIKSRRLKAYRDRKIIPFIKTGRSVLYDPEAVVLALKKLERAPVGIPGKREKKAFGRGYSAGGHREMIARTETAAPAAPATSPAHRRMAREQFSQAPGHDAASRQGTPGSILDGSVVG